MESTLLTEALPLTEEVTTETIEAVNESAPADVPETEQRVQTPLEQMINRRTGFFTVKISPADVRWIANACKDDKFAFTGPNEAFMVMNCYMGFSAAVARFQQEGKTNETSAEELDINAAAIEAAAILISKYTGKGLDAAQRVFRIAMALNGPAMEMRSLDKVINQLKQADAAEALPQVSDLEPEDVLGEEEQPA